ncbi:MAG TPA: hypothetical protein VFR42_05400, partial [Candidatus Acidoferrum sp.]|nr:hypothetical protein [Candidatus Acidoferrum sp.]
DLALLDLAWPCAVAVKVLRNIRTKKPELPLPIRYGLRPTGRSARCLTGRLFASYEAPAIKSR